MDDGMEGKESLHFESNLVRESQKCCNTYHDWEKRSKQAEDKCAVLELEVQKKNSEFELLQGRFGVLAGEKLAIEENLRVLKKKNDELEQRIILIENSSTIVDEGWKGIGRIVDLTDETDEEDKVFQLMIENKVLECEKKNAESKVDVWKAKFKELESRVLEMEEKFLSTGKERKKGGSELPEMGAKEMNEASGLEDGLGVATSSTYMQAENEMVDSDEIIHAVTGVVSTCSHSAKGIGDQQASGTPLIDTPCKQSTYLEGGKRGILPGTELKSRKRVKKQLAFGQEGSPNKKMAPSTPGGAGPASVGVIDISDSDGESDSMPNLETQGNTVSFSTSSALGDTLSKTEFAFKNNSKSTLSDQSDEEDMGDYKGSFPFVSTPRRKRGSNIVTSDSESSDDDNLPISNLKTKRHRESYTDSYLSNGSVKATVSTDEIKGPGSRRHLVTLRKLEGENGPERSSPGQSNFNTSETKDYPGISTNEDVEEDKMEVDDGSDSEGESLGGFIVDSSGVSDNDDGSSESEDSSDGNMDYKDIISRIRRNRGHNMKWEFEADMLAAFGKDPELCMKAVCALYRQQTSEEKSSKETIYSNQRGFSQCDAYRGSALAEFLTDGDPKGDLIKNVEELREYNPKGLELCRTLATHYSKQLFAIYKNKEDPFFLPP